MAYAIAAAAVLAVSGAALERGHRASLEQASRDVRAAQDISHAAIARADLERAAALVARAQASAATSRADSSQQRESVLRVRLAAARVNAPAPCEPILVLADSALAAADSANADLRSANSRLARSLDSTDAALVGLRAAQVNLDAKATVLVHAAQPGWRSRLAAALPKAGIGFAGGVNPVTGKPAVVLGVTLGWSR